MLGAEHCLATQSFTAESLSDVTEAFLCVYKLLNSVVLSRRAPSRRASGSLAVYVVRDGQSQCSTIPSASVHSSSSVLKVLFCTIPSLSIL